MEAGINPILEVFCIKRSQASGASRSLRPGWTHVGGLGRAVWDRMLPALRSGVGDKGGVSGNREDDPPGVTVASLSGPG